MAKRPGPNDGTQPTVPLEEQEEEQEEEEEEEDVSLEEILRLYSQPINEEQAWAVCYQTCRGLALHHRRRRRRRRNSSSNSNSSNSSGPRPRRLRGPADLRVRRDGTLELRGDGGDGGSDKHTSAPTSLQVIDSLGVMIYKALDFGLKESEERELSAPLERLIDLMTNTEASESDGCPDEGYEATEEEEEEEEEEEGPEPGSASTAVTNIRGYRDVITLCSSHLRRPSEAPAHYQAVCRALYAEARELRTFLQKIKNAKENLRRMEGEETAEPAPDLNQLQNADWARFWVQVMRDLRDGVKLKKVHERHYDPLPIEFQLTPYEMLMDDIRSKRYTLRKVMVNGDVPPRLKKSAHEVILEFIRSRPPLNPVAARKLKPHPPRPPSLHERLLEDIKAERKLRPVSPDMIRRSRLGAGKSISTPQDLFRGSDTPDAPRKLAVSTQSLADSHSGGVPLAQRKRLLRAPTLAELDSSESEEEVTRSSSSTSVPLMDTSSDGGRKAPPNFLPSAPRRRHSMERASPGGVRPFAPPPSRQSSKSLEEFCNPLEVLALTVDEVMHIRQVLVKAELEKFQQYKEVYSALKKGKLCFSCRIKRFSLFTWSYTCQFCKRPVCSQCSTKMRLPSKPYATLPIYSLGGGSGSNSRDEGCVEAERQPFGSGAVRHSLRRSGSRASRGREARQEELLPAALTEDWVSMEVCVDCKKFISDIISSSKRSLNVASKRVRRNRKTQSFYMASSASVNFRPSERPIKEL